MRISDWSSDVCSSDLVVADDRQVDQKAEHAGAEEVPEAHRHQEIERPLIRHAFALTLLIAFRLCGTDEVPGVERQQGQRYDFQRRKQRGNGQIHLGLSVEVPVVTGDRKSVVEGKSVSVRVDLGGRRSIKKKKRQ